MDGGSKTLDMYDEKSLLNVHRLLRVLSNLLMSIAEAVRVFSNVKRALNRWRSTMSGGCLLALILAEAYSENLPSTSEIVY